MKKLLYIALAAALLLALAACGGGKNDAPPLYAAHHVADIDKAGAFSETLEELDCDTAFALYKLADCGLAREDLKECTALRSAGATCEETAVLILADADKAKAAAGALQDYVAGQIEANTDYRPAEIPKLEAALIDQRGESVLLVVAHDLDAAKSAVE